MIVARLSISYDRGTSRNTPSDVGARVGVDETTEDGGIVRGLGSRWRDQEARDAAKACAAEERRIRVAFGRRFLAAPIPGLFVVPDRETPRDILRDLVGPDSSLTARLAVYDMAPRGALPPAEVLEWSKRVQGQLAAAPLGRSKLASTEGLDVLRQLATCPVLGDDTRAALGELIASAELERIDRKELRRRLEILPIDLVGCETPQPARALPEQAPIDSLA